jgi:hypothetical protein
LRRAPLKAFRSQTIDVTVRLAIALAALAVTAAPASAATTGWRADGNVVCMDYFDQLAVLLGEDMSTPEQFTGVARLTERKDDRLARLHPPAPAAAPFAEMLRHDRRGARALRDVARAMKHGDGSGFERLLNRYDRETKAYVKLARRLSLSTCAGDGDAVTGPAVEL